MSEEVLKRLGLSRDVVKLHTELLGWNNPTPYSEDGGDDLQLEENNEDEPKAEYNYKSGDSYRKTAQRIKVNDLWLKARYLEGYSPSLLSGLLNVSEESVRKRLRKAEFLNPKGKCGPQEKSKKKHLCSNSPNRLATRWRCL